MQHRGKSKRYCWCRHGRCRTLQAKAHRVALRVQLPLSLLVRSCQQLQRSGCVAIKGGPARV